MLEQSISNRVLFFLKNDSNEKILFLIVTFFMGTNVSSEYGVSSMNIEFLNNRKISAPRLMVSHPY